MQNSGQIPTILIIEDIQWIRSSMRKAVERHGYSVLEAKDYTDVFPFAESQKIDLILTEEEVPNFNELMVLLHEGPTLRSVPVVIINPDAEDGARLGDAYLLADYSDLSSFLAVLQH